MTNFKNRIKPDSTELEKYFLSVYTGNLWNALEKIKDWHSPEYIEKEVQTRLLKLQQQSLPVVPEDVDKAIKYLKTQNNFATFADFDDILTEKGLKWLNNFQFKDRRFGFGGLNNKLFILSHLAITGYEVEKPQLFYLCEKNTGYYLRKSGTDWSTITCHYTNDYDENYMNCKFTQKEIDKLDTGSYDIVPVEDKEK